MIKGNWEYVTDCELALNPKMIRRIVAIEKIIPLNGLPVIQAKIATDNIGTDIISSNTLFEGTHFEKRKTAKI
jgi:hypothetical protein